MNIFLAGLNRSKYIYIYFFFANIRPLPKTKLPKLVEIVPDMYPDLLFVDMSRKPLKISEKGVHMPPFSKYSFITPSRGWHRVAQGDMTNWHTLRVQMHLLCQQSGDYIQEVPWFCISTNTQKGRQPYLSLLFSYHHLYKLTMNQTKYLVPLLLTSNNQEKSINIPKIISHLSLLMLPLEVCKLNTS